MNRNISIIVPFFNEEKTLRQSLTSLINEKFADVIILVDDGSTDSSKNIAKEFVRDYENINFISLKSNSGKGAAIKAGIKSLDTYYFGIFDADLEYSALDLKIMYQEILNNSEIDFICGSRFIGEKNRSNRYLRTLFANKFLSNIFSIVHNKKVTDIATCLKIFKKEIFKNTKLKENGFSVEVELLSIAINFSNNFMEIPIQYSARSYKEGKKIKFKDGLNYIYKIFKYKNKK